MVDIPTIYLIKSNKKFLYSLQIASKIQYKQVLYFIVLFFQISHTNNNYYLQVIIIHLLDIDILLNLIMCFSVILRKLNTITFCKMNHHDNIFKTMCISMKIV
jgi:hypothetical protein